MVAIMIPQGAGILDFMIVGDYVVTCGFKSQKYDTYTNEYAKIIAYSIKTNGTKKTKLKIWVGGE